MEPLNAVFFGSDVPTRGFYRAASPRLRALSKHLAMAGVAQHELTVLFAGIESDCLHISGGRVELVDRLVTHFIEDAGLREVARNPA
ncbi:hypothetical protein HLB23_06410 [Nocardia uniformis]|uniref:Uncharacterized protein n=1 Tax=Nocardia uniformis TaxID=53432 RepID=A0A849BSE5_9NOCA|nr:hypothetical protein [Nocardia uniformis]NNH69503.1 hypothetical protein [Nocardia uniformis]